MPFIHEMVRMTPEPLRKLLRKLKIHLLLPSLEELPDSPDLFRAYRTWEQDPRLSRRPGGWIYRSAFYPDYLTVGGASQAIVRKASSFCRGQGIDIGAGFWPLMGAIPVDINRGPGLVQRISDFSARSLDFVFSSHCLEHIENWRETLGEWVDKLKPEGTIFLYLPHPACAIWSPGSPFVGEGHKWSPRPEVMRAVLQEMHCDILDADDGPDMMQSFFVCARKRGENGSAN